MSHLWPEGEAVEVTMDELGQPIQVVWGGKRHIVQAIANRWRLDEAWWRERIWRDYFKVTTQAGALLILYRDLSSGAWFIQRLYD